MSAAASRSSLFVSARAFWTGPFDARPLALMRITFGVALVFALLDIAPVLFDLLSDEGVLPRGALLSGLARANRVSVMDMAGPKFMCVAMLAAAIFASLCFTVGFHTRVATIASFVLVTGIHERNLAVFDGADNVIRVLLFWLMFAPTGAHYSIDALRRSKAETSRLEAHALTTRLVELQFSWIYLASALGKLRGPTWRSGTALHYALSLDHLFTRKLGMYVADVKPLIVGGTYGALAAEGAFFFLAFSPVLRKQTRILAVLLGAGLHAGIALTMRVGNFSHLMIACYPLLLPGDWAEHVVNGVASRLGIEIATPNDEPRSPSSDVAATARSDAPARPSPATRIRSVAHALLATLFVFTVWFSAPRARTVHLPTPPAFLSNVIPLLELWQLWDMFAPDPAQADFYLRGVGLLKNGKGVDVLHGLDGGPLPPPEPGFFFSRWTKFISNLAYSEQPQLLPFGSFLCRRWNTSSGSESRSPLATFKVFREQQPTAPLGAPKNAWSEQLIWDHHCF